MLNTIQKLIEAHKRVTNIHKGPTRDMPYDEEIIGEVCTKHEAERVMLAELFYHLVVLNSYLNSSEIVALVEWLQKSDDTSDPAMLRIATAL